MNDQALRDHLLELLKGGSAHSPVEELVLEFPEVLRSRTAAGFSNTPWRLLEHVRLAQWDILEFSRDAEHVSPEFPKGYWPETDVPPNDDAWGKSVEAWRRDLDATMDLVKDPTTDLYAPIPHGTGQTILREVLLIADHNAYHLGQLMMMRRVLEGEGAG